MLNDLLVTCRLTRGVRAIAESFGVIWPNRSERILFVTEAEAPAHGPLDPVLELLESLAFLEDEENVAVRRVCQNALDLMKWLVRKAQTSEWWPAHRASLQWAAWVSEEFMQLLEAKEPAASITGPPDRVFMQHELLWQWDSCLLDHLPPPAAHTQLARLLPGTRWVDDRAQVLTVTLRELLNAPKKLRRSGTPYCARGRIPPGH
ncbi:hypothetical protein NHJ13734_009267 [Beauveria thailandica]